MNGFKVLIRSFFKKGKNNNLIKIVSLSVGLALGLVLIAKVHFEQSYDDFFDNSSRIYQIQANYETQDGTMEPLGQIGGGVAVGIKAEIPEVEAATRYTWFFGNQLMVTPEKRKYESVPILADSCLFDVFSLPILAGNPKEVLSRPNYVMISLKIANRLGGVSRIVGQTFHFENFPRVSLTVGGVFEDLPANSHMEYDVVVSLSSISQFMADHSLAWVGSERYPSYVKLQPGTLPASLIPRIQQVKEKYLPKEELQKAGIDVEYSLVPLLKVHSSLDETKRNTWLLSLLALALLFTAVMNYILIVISSIVNRSKEMAIHKCYGASSGNIYGRMLAETGIDLLIALAMAALLIFFFRGTILSLTGTGIFDLFTWKSLSPLLIVCLLVFLLSGLIPGYLYARIPVATAFRRFSENRRYWKLALLFVQFIAAGLFLTLVFVIGRQYNYMVKDNPGYNFRNVIYCQVSGVEPALKQKAYDEVKRLPEVVDITTCSRLLFNGSNGINVRLPEYDEDLFNAVDMHETGSNFFNLMEIPIIEGSIFKDAVSSQEVMVSRNFAERLSAYGKQEITGTNIILQRRGQRELQTYTICGVYDDVRIGIIGREDTRPSLMFHTSQPAEYLMIKLHKQSPETITALSDMLSRLMPTKEMEVHAYSTNMKNLYADSRNFRDQVMIGGIVALLICLIGLIGYTNDEMSRRKKETAIRKINGATLYNIQHLFLTDISRMALPALLLGGICAYYISEKWLLKFTDKVSLPFLFFVGCGTLVLVIIVGSVSINCYRAASENPANIVRSE